MKILASSSKANCYAFDDGKSTILVECGLNARKTLMMLDWKLPDAALVTHEHSDHARSARKFLERGVDMYMTAGTAQALGLNRHNLHVIKPGVRFTVCGHEILPFKVTHDAAEPVNFTIDDMLFITDAGAVPDIGGKFRKVYIEANYDPLTLYNSFIDDGQKQRIRENHLSIYQATNFLKTLDEPEEVWLIHRSLRHADAEDFIRRVRQATGFRNVLAA